MTEIPRAASPSTRSMTSREATVDAATLTSVLPRRMDERSLSGCSSRRRARLPPEEPSIRFF